MGEGWVCVWGKGDTGAVAPDGNPDVSLVTLTSYQGPVCTWGAYKMPHNLCSGAFFPRIGISTWILMVGLDHPWWSLWSLNYTKSRVYPVSHRYLLGLNELLWNSSLLKLSCCNLQGMRNVYFLSPAEKMKETLVFRLYMRCVKHQILNMFWNPSRLIFSPSNPIGGLTFPLKVRLIFVVFLWNYQRLQQFEVFWNPFPGRHCLAPRGLSEAFILIFCCVRSLMCHNNMRKSYGLTQVCILCRPRATFPFLFLCISDPGDLFSQAYLDLLSYIF